MFGYKRKEVMGRDLNLILRPDCSRDHRKAVQKYLEKRAPRRINHQTEVIITRKDGETFPASISFSVARIQGRPFFTAIIQDMAETQFLKEQVAKAERLAALGRIVAEITHDIKNPLLIVGAYARQLMKRTGDPASSEKLALIAEEVTRLEGLLGEINDYYLARPLNWERFDIHDVMREICFLAGNECQEKKIRLECRMTRAAAWVKGDRNRWKQAFLNLIRNGIEALEEGGNLSFTSRVRTRSVEIHVRDDGAGIPASIQEQIFEPFFTTKEKGTGLGLSICKKIVESHPGSSIELTSRKGKGTQVRVTIPRVLPAARHKFKSRSTKS